MDGLKQVTTLDGAHAPVGRTHQQTLKSAISCVGIGVHTGRRTAVTLRPTEANDGIVFHRTDLNRLIPATYDRVTDTRLSTVIADPEWASARVGTIEHLMAAFAAKGIDNALVEVDGPELPNLDGSAAPVRFLLDCAGTETLAAPRRVI
ncbi:MAG: UDP-3-O-acyl-N-acetylglucosamine deacetylase, partial [Acetobacteraceae bacterium]